MTLSSRIVSNCGRYFLPSFSSVLEAMESIVNAETREEPWLGMLTAEERHGKVIDVTIKD